MALRNLSTSFRSLKFGKDQPGGGHSNSPYIITSLPAGFEDDFTGLAKLRSQAMGASYDFPIRGGALSVVDGTIDLERITKFYLDAPKGPLFIAKQVGLQLSNPKIETGITAGLENTRIYNLGLNTLAQIPSTALGIHFDRSGLLPIIAEQNKYETVVTRKNLNTITGGEDNPNRLVKLYQDKIQVSRDTSSLDKKIQAIEDKFKKFSSTKIGGFLDKITNNSVSNFVTNNIDKIKRTLNPKYFLIDQYVGGPSSVYGIGTTTINRYTFTDNPRTNNYEPDTVINYYGLLGASFAYPYDFEKGLNKSDPTLTPDYLKQTNTTNKDEEIINSILEKKVLGNKPSIPTSFSKSNTIALTYNLIRKQKEDSATDWIQKPDFRKVINDNLGDGFNIVPNTDYITYNMEKRIGIGNPGKIARSRMKVNDIDESTQDQINMLPLFKEDISDDAGGTVTINGVKRSTRDLVKFRFEAVNNDKLTESTKIIFRAFIDSFGDSMGANWNTFKYNGRGENFFTYEGFNRDIYLSFKIAAQSRSEMKPLYQKLNYLMSNLAPDYQQNGFMRGPFILFTLGSWFYRQPSIINSLDISLDGNTVWEIAMNQPENGEDNDMAELPQILSVNMSLTPIHNFIPRKGATVPFIKTGNHNTNNWLSPSEFTNL